MEVYLPGAGWKGFDPTSGIMTGSQHVTVAVSRNPENAAPVAGSFQGPSDAFQGIQVDVTVVQIDRPMPPVAPVPVPALNPPLQNQMQSQVNPIQTVQQAQQMAQQITGDVPAMGMVIQPRIP
jgi:hypothetical protein